MARKQPARKASLEHGLAHLRGQYGGRLLPPLEGLAYRFTIWLPIQAKGRVVFSEVDRYLIGAMLNHCFGGYSQSRVDGFPPWSGSWLPEGAQEPIIDHHVQLIAYTLQDEEASLCMRQLKWLLQQEHIAGQAVVLIEQYPVRLIEALEMSI